MSDHTKIHRKMYGSRWTDGLDWFERQPTLDCPVQERAPDGSMEKIGLKDNQLWIVLSRSGGRHDLARVILLK